MAILAPGDKILAAHRKLFESDAPRYFAGTVTDYEGGVFKVLGHSFFHDAATGRVFKKEDQRTKIGQVGRSLKHDAWGMSEDPGLPSR